MSAPMATNLRAANAKLTVYNRTASKCAGLTQNGSIVAATPKVVAQKTDTGFIILCVSDKQSLKSAICDTNGVLSGLVPGVTVIDMGTSTVTETRRIAGGQYIDAPVSSGEVGAKAPQPAPSV